MRENCRTSQGQLAAWPNAFGRSWGRMAVKASWVPPGPRGRRPVGHQAPNPLF
jgi:hypothetical protein